MMPLSVLSFYSHIKTTMAAIAGGTASVLGGGSFANGAMTGAFIMLFNEMRKIQFDAESKKAILRIRYAIRASKAIQTILGGSKVLFIALNKGPQAFIDLLSEMGAPVSLSPSVGQTVDAIANITQIRLRVIVDIADYMRAYESSLNNYELYNYWTEVSNEFNKYR